MNKITNCHSKLKAKFSQDMRELKFFCHGGTEK